MGMRIFKENFPQRTTSAPVPFNQLRQFDTDSECLPDFMFVGTNDFNLGCCVISYNGTLTTTLVRLGGSVTTCERYEELNKKTALIDYGKNFFGCDVRPKRVLAYNPVAYILIGIILLLKTVALILILVYKLCVGKMDTSKEWVQKKVVSHGNKQKKETQTPTPVDGKQEPTSVKSEEAGGKV